MFPGQNNLVGTIPDSIGNLLYMDELTMPGNKLSGTLPSSIGALKNLWFLYLALNELSGTIPEGVGSLTYLTYLDLSANQFSGTIPPLARLTGLTQLRLAINKLSGTIPALNSLTEVNGIYLSSNNLVGDVPPVGNLTVLSQLDISNNELNGTIHDSLGTLKSMNSIYLFNNKLVGTIPNTFSSTTNYTAIIVLDLSNNVLVGTIPPLYSLTSIQKINLSKNLLHGTIPDVQGLSALWIFDLSDNQLNGTLPSSVGSLISVQKIDISRNNISGSLPTTIQLLSKLQLLSAHTNHLSVWSNICNQTGNRTTGIETLDLSFNLFTYVHWEDINNCLYLHTLFMSKNKLTYVLLPQLYLTNFDLSYNEISNLNSTGNSKIISINLSHNNISMQLYSLSNFFTVNTPLLTVLNVAGNKIKGNIIDLRLSSTMTSINLNNNLIDGNLTFSPFYISYSITSLCLSGNMLSGTIPNRVGSTLSHYIKELILDNNYLSGVLPQELPPLIERLSLQNNNFIGTIPKEWGNLKRLVEVNLGGNSLCGCAPTSWNYNSLTTCNLIGLKSSCDCELPRPCKTELLKCDISVNDSKCGINQCEMENLCHQPRKCSPKIQNGYYYGYECTQCSGVLENSDLFKCRPSLMIILTPTLSFVFLIVLVTSLCIAKRLFSSSHAIELPESWFWDISRLKRQNYSKCYIEPQYYYKQLTNETQKENNLFQLLIKKLEFEEFKIKACFAIASPILAQSVSNTLKIQKSRMNRDRNTFFSVTWRYDQKKTLREKVFNHFVGKCLEWEWNETKSIEDCYVLPVVHGTSMEIGWKIASNGFAVLSTLDQGYYGKGIYFTTSALYTVPYLENKKKPAIIICFTIPGNPYPVIENPNSRDSFFGKHIVERYQSHYCKTSAGGIPYTDEDELNSVREFDELVIEQESQIVPLFLTRVSISEELKGVYKRVLPIHEAKLKEASQVRNIEISPTDQQGNEKKPLLRRVKKEQTLQPVILN
uniref:PARP catalytic domain-containing protein n=1 Tax=Arcella intermedia TaxID=1963864 RepID=A0A6B2KWV9_9EUKA